MPWRNPKIYSQTVFLGPVPAADHALHLPSAHFSFASGRLMGRRELFGTCHLDLFGSEEAQTWRGQCWQE